MNFPPNGLRKRPSEESIAQVLSIRTFTLRCRLEICSVEGRGDPLGGEVARRDDGTTGVIWTRRPAAVHDCLQEVLVFLMLLAL